MRLPRFTKPYRLKDYNFTLVFLVLALSILGVLVVGSARDIYQGRQIIGVVIGLVAMAVVSLMDYEWILNFYWILYGIAVLSLALVLVIGQEVNGATRWINLGFTTFQPSELAKILLILFFARFIMRHEEDLNDKWTLLKYAGLCGVPLALIIVEPNLSTTICTAFGTVSDHLYRRAELPLYPQSPAHSDPSDCDLSLYCSSAKSAFSEGVSAEAYPGLPGTGKICQR